MSDELRSQFEKMPTAELVRILRAHDLDEWRPDVFPAVELVLQERGVDIDAALAAAELERPPAHQAGADLPDFAEALTLPDPALLPVAKSLLEQAGVQYFVRNEATQGLFGWGQIGSGFNFITGPPVLMVDRTRLREVQELLQPLVAGADSDAEGVQGAIEEGNEPDGP